MAHFTHTHRDFNPVRVVNDVLFLELRPTTAMLRNYQTVDVPKEVGIRVHRRLNPASSKDVATAYEETLSDAGIPCGASDSVSLDCEFREGYLWMCVKNGREVPEERAPSVWQGREPQFPHPRLVGALYHALYGNLTEDKDGFARYLHTRLTGRAPEVYNFVPACTAFFLRTYGKLKWREIFSHLNENMLRDWHPRGPVPNERDDFPKHRSRSTQLTDDVKKVGQEVLRVAYVLHHPAE